MEDQKEKSVVNGLSTTSCLDAIKLNDLHSYSDKQQEIEVNEEENENSECDSECTLDTMKTQCYPNLQEINPQVEENEEEEHKSKKEHNVKKKPRNRPRARGGSTPRVYPDLNEELNDE